MLGEAKKLPIAGKIRRANEFNINIVPRAVPVCRSSGFITDAIAAIALPPQIAVPDEISRSSFCRP